MQELGIDIETYSSNDLVNSGVYKYVEAPDFTVLLFSYSEDGGPVKCVDFAMGETLPQNIRRALTDPVVIKTAFNASFERICLGKYYGQHLDAAQWRWIFHAILSQRLSYVRKKKTHNKIQP